MSATAFLILPVALSTMLIVCLSSLPIGSFPAVNGVNIDRGFRCRRNSG
jgi:hypothetical protein